MDLVNTTREVYEDTLLLNDDKGGFLIVNDETDHL